jgi:nucleotide-binding universal stress UspA family protein
MKKILLAFDSSHFSEGAFEFARELNERKRILLTGIFLPQVDYANLWSYSGGGINGPLYIPAEEVKVAEVDVEEGEKNIERFESLCMKNGIEYRVHKDFTDFAMPGLKKETRFADLLIIGSEAFYDNLGKGDPNDYLKDALHGVECPVIVVPEKFDFPKSNILAYDGSESSVYAIKQFAYLLPELTENATILVYSKENEETLFPEEENIEELAARHFPDLTLSRLDASLDKFFNKWLLQRKTAILICGSFGRSAISRLFHKSFVSNIIKDHRMPVFITHHK